MCQVPKPHVPLTLSLCLCLSSVCSLFFSLLSSLKTINWFLCVGAKKSLHLNFHPNLIQWLTMSMGKMYLGQRSVDFSFVGTSTTFITVSVGHSEQGRRQFLWYKQSPKLQLKEEAPSGLFGTNNSWYLASCVKYMWWLLPLPFTGFSQSRQRGLKQSLRAKEFISWCMDHCVFSVSIREQTDTAGVKTLLSFCPTVLCTALNTNPPGLVPGLWTAFHISDFCSNWNRSGLVLMDGCFPSWKYIWASCSFSGRIIIFLCQSQKIRDR